MSSSSSPSPQNASGRTATVAGADVSDLELLGKFVDPTHDFYFVMGPSGERLFVSPSFYRLLGYTPEEVQTIDFRTRIHPDDLERVLQAREENFAGKPTDIRYRAVCKDGGIRTFDLSANPIVDAQGKLERLVCCAREVPDGGEGAPAEQRSEIRVLIVDDHAVLRQGLRMLLSSQPDINVVGEAGDGETALKLARTVKPDVVTLDLAMPEMGGLAILERLRTDSPAVRVLVLTMHDDAAYLKAVVAGGGAGYVTKTADESEVLAAVRTIYQGKAYFGQNMNDVLARALLGEQKEEAAPPTPAALLSEREREVLADVAQGYTNQQIADRLFLSVKTIETYRSRLMSKLGLSDRAQLVRFALQAGLLKSSPTQERGSRG